MTVKKHSTEFRRSICKVDGFAFTRCGRAMPLDRVVFGNDTRRVTCGSCRSIKKARTP